MKEEKTEGIVLRSHEFQETSRLIALYTPTKGLIHLVVKKISNPRLMALTTPFTCGEFHYFEGKSRLFRFQEGSVLDEHLLLRKRFSSLKTAGEMTAALLFILLPESPDLPLYTLYKSYLKQIPFFDDPSLLISSFYLKLLKYEGLLEWEEISPAERSLAENLVSVRSFDILRTLNLSQEIHAWTNQKVKKFINNRR